jgi:hypothetical protein
MTPDSDSRGLSLTGVLGILTGIWIVIVLALDIATPTPSPVNALSSYLGNVDIFWAGLAATAMLGAIGIPFLAGLGRVLTPRSSTVAWGSSLLLIVGILVMVITEAIEVVGLWAVTQGPTTGMFAASATVQASFAYTLGTESFGFGFFFLGAGLVLMAWVSWSSELFPKWLSALILIGGVTGLVAPIMVGPLALVSIVFAVITSVALVVMSFLVGYKLLRPPGASARGTAEHPSSS